MLGHAMHPFGPSAVLVQLLSLAQEFQAAVPACPEGPKHCVGIEVFVTVEDGAPVQTPAWLAGEVKHLNELFAVIDVGFELAAVRFIGAEWAQVHSRADRDALGERARDPGVVHLFMVRRLDDVDIEGAILYGVHWRKREDRSQRWIILSDRDVSSTVLPHEMGHYFGAPHSTYEESIMNKAPRLVPAWPDRVFADAEEVRMRRHRDRMLGDGTLVDRPRSGG
jgi:hypothetical protein